MRKVNILWGATGVLLIGLIVMVCLAVYAKSVLPGTGSAGRDDPGVGRDDNRAIAKIGDRIISYREFMQELEDSYGLELLNRMLDREAVMQEAKSLNITVEEREIDEELKQMQQGYDSEQQFYESMKEQLGLTKEELREETLYKLLLERIAIRGIEVSEEEVDEYIRNHPEELASQTKLHIYQIIVPTEEEAQKIIAELKGGADFAELAIERSIDESTANNGGDAGFVQLNDPFVQPPIMEAAKSLDVNAISGPIEVDEGYAVIKLAGREQMDGYEKRKWREKIRKEIALGRAASLTDTVKRLREKRNAVILDPKYR